MIKTEIQGNHGIVNRVKKEVLPPGVKLAKSAIDELGINSENVGKDECRKNFNELLFAGLRKEYELYLSIESRLYDVTFDKLLSNAEDFASEFPESAAKMKRIVQLVSNCDEPKDTALRILKELMDFIPIFEQSLSQGRSTRAGGSLQNHLSNLFKVSEFIFQTQTKLNGPVDFLFPGIEYFQQYKHDSIILSAKRTLRERWKQDSNYIKLADVGRLFLATTEGYDFTRNSVKRIPSGQLKELRNSNISLVVHDEVKNRYHNDDSVVYGFSEFASETLPHYENLWLKRLSN